jgi:hypothetical protein
METYEDENGYLRFSDTDKLVHRWAAEKKLGRKLREGEVVHHKDRNKKNNSPENLWVFKDQEKHDRVHKYDAYKHGFKAGYSGFAKKESENTGCMLSGIMIVVAVIGLFLLIHLM